jgi:delta 1-pyrroline-5-carboxylate dehydrogenase
MTLCRSRRCCGPTGRDYRRARSCAASKIPLPADLYRPERTNSRGIEFGERAALNKLLAEIAASKPDMDEVG